MAIFIHLKLETRAIGNLPIYKKEVKNKEEQNTFRMRNGLDCLIF